MARGNNVSAEAGRSIGWGWSFYVLTWAVMAGAAAAYLTTPGATARIAAITTSGASPSAPARLASQKPPTRMQRRLSAAQSALARQTQRAEALRAQLQTKKARIKTLTQARDEARRRAAELKQGLDEPGQRPKPAQVSANNGPAETATTTQPSEPKPNPGTDASDVASAGDTTKPVRQTQLPPPLPPRAHLARASRPAPSNVASSTSNVATSNLTTGSLRTANPQADKLQSRAPSAKSKAVGFQTKVVTPATMTESNSRDANAFSALRLSTAPSLNSLRLSWRLLKERHGSVLEGLQPKFRAIPGGVTGVSYQLVAGPVLSRVEADDLCDRLRPHGVNCSSDIFSGDKL